METEDEKVARVIAAMKDMDIDVTAAQEQILGMALRGEPITFTLPFRRK